MVPVIAVFFLVIRKNLIESKKKTDAKKTIEEAEAIKNSLDEIPSPALNETEITTETHSTDEDEGSS